MCEDGIYFSNKILKQSIDHLQYSVQFILEKDGKIER